MRECTNCGSRRLQRSYIAPFDSAYRGPALFGLGLLGLLSGVWLALSEATQRPQVAMLLSVLLLVLLVGLLAGPVWRRRRQARRLGLLWLSCCQQCQAQQVWHQHAGTAGNVFEPIDQADLAAIERRLRVQRRRPLQLALLLLITLILGMRLPDGPRRMPSPESVQRFSHQLPPQQP